MNQRTRFITLHSLHFIGHTLSYLWVQFYTLSKSNCRLISLHSQNISILLCTSWYCCIHCKLPCCGNRISSYLISSYSSSPKHILVMRLVSTLFQSIPNGDKRTVSKVVPWMSAIFRHRVVCAAGTVKCPQKKWEQSDLTQYEPTAVVILSSVVPVV